MLVEDMRKVALGGGCHWCTEAVFQSLRGVTEVSQGWVASSGLQSSFSEAVIVVFDPAIISLKDLIEIHLHTHKSTSAHSMRKKYRSAVYFFSKEQEKEAKEILNSLQAGFKLLIITQVLPFCNFKPSREEITNYYYRNPERPFCKKYIQPKLQLLRAKYEKQLKSNLEDASQY